jgi:hypothetical protein
VQNVNLLHISNAPIELEDHMDVGDQNSNQPQYFVERFQGAGETFGAGENFMDQFDKDQFSLERVDNVYYPFASRSK